MVVHTSHYLMSSATRIFSSSRYKDWTEKYEVPTLLDRTSVTSSHSSGHIKLSVEVFSEHLTGSCSFFPQLIEDPGLARVHSLLARQFSSYLRISASVLKCASRV